VERVFTEKDLPWSKPHWSKGLDPKAEFVPQNINNMSRYAVLYDYCYYSSDCESGHSCAWATYLGDDQEKICIKKEDCDQKVNVGLVFFYTDCSGTLNAENAQKGEILLL
jgi:hypothetical protein